MKKTLDSAFVFALVQKYRNSKTKGWWHIDGIVPVVLMEAEALGPHALVWLGGISAKLTLDDGHRYRLGYKHKAEAFVLHRMVKSASGNYVIGPLVTMFRNGTAPKDVWAALHPKAAAVKAA